MQNSNQHSGLLNINPAGLAALALATGMQAVATHPGLVALVPASLQALKEMCGRLSHTHVESLLEMERSPIWRWPVRGQDTDMHLPCQTRCVVLIWEDMMPCRMRRGA